MSAPEKWRTFDLAKSTVLSLIACYSKMIYEEEHRAAPDMEKITRWESEMDSLGVLSETLDADDQATIEDIYSAFKPVLLLFREKGISKIENPFELDKAEHDRFYVRIARGRLSRAEPQENPIAVIIGGQPGSGKSALTARTKKEMTQGGYVLVDPNELRPVHPRYEELMCTNDREAAGLTHSDASTWAKRLTHDAMEGRRNLIIEQTAKNPDALVALTTELRQAGYHVELRVMAVKDEISQLRIYVRYENEKEELGTGRFVPTKVHDAAYQGLPMSLAAIEHARSVNVLTVYDRNLTCIHENTLRVGEDDASRAR